MVSGNVDYIVKGIELVDLDADILTLKRQYANFNLFEQSFMSNSAEDISQLDRLSYQPDLFGQGQEEIDEGKDLSPYE